MSRATGDRLIPDRGGSMLDTGIGMLDAAEAEAAAAASLTE